MAGTPARTDKAVAERKKRAAEWKRLRTKNLLSQSALAGLLDVAKDTVYLVEAGRVTPRFSTLAKFDSLKKTYEREAKR